MKQRREWLKMAAVVALASAAGGWRLAQAQTQQRYVLLEPAQETPREFIEVIEFFHYGCPHCREFDPLVSVWAAGLPSDVRFRHVPVVWGQRALEGLARFYYTLEALDLAKSLHSKVFAAVQDEKKALYERDAAAAWVAAQGGDRDAFVKVWESFAVQTRVRQADRAAREHQIKGVPTLAIAGRYLTSAALTGSHAEALREADTLIARVRAERQGNGK